MLAALSRLPASPHEDAIQAFVPKLTVSLVTTLLCCVIAELALRLISPVQTCVNPLNSFHRFDSERGWLGVPNREAKFRKPDFDVMIRTDADGFRKRESAVQPRPGNPD